MDNAALTALQRLYDERPEAFEEFIRTLNDAHFKFGSLTLIFKDARFACLRKESTYL